MLAWSIIKSSRTSNIRTCLPAGARSTAARRSLGSGGGRASPGIKTQVQRKAQFHSTAPRSAAPLLILGALKASTGLQVVKTASRVVLTFLPLILLKNYKNKHQLNHPAFEEKKAALEDRIRIRTRLIQALLLGPALLFWATILASLERTPLTGRWRLILLSPEEEVEISSQLSGANWFAAVRDILMLPGGEPPKAIPYNDWRYIWVQDTLRQLESAVPLLHREHDLEPRWLEEGGKPLPPPSDYPLVARARVSKWMCEKSHQVTARTESEEFDHQVIPGPPYSLVVVDDPTAANAFSYGFGAGGAGIVVYSGILNEIMSTGNIPSTSVIQEQSWLSKLLGASSQAQYTETPVPTQEQTAQLAILLAHELSHLLLAHHLESLSSGTIIIPGVLSLLADIARTLLFPATMMFGPFVNDAVAQITKIGSTALTSGAEHCISVKQEIEADVASVRILAYAGFDARDAVSFWDKRKSHNRALGCSPTARGNAHSPGDLPHFAEGDSHPLVEARVDSLRKELQRWELERRVKLHQTTQTTSDQDELRSLKHI